MKKIVKKPGFTIIEVSLAIVFVSVLILTIGYLTINITSTYEKGLAMKSVNSTGKEIIDDLSRVIEGSPAQTVDSLCSEVYSVATISGRTAREKCIKDKARKVIYQQYYNTVEINGKDENVPVAGVFCTGRYSYLWNTAYTLNSKDYKHKGGNYSITFKNNSHPDTNNFRLLKVSDFSRSVCKTGLSRTDYQYYHPGVIESRETLLTYEDLLEQTKSDDYASSNLALYDFTLFYPSVHKITSSGFYSASFVLATLRGGININTTGEFCSDPPDNLNTDFAYCAVNKFNFSAKAEGEKLDSERW